MNGAQDSTLVKLVREGETILDRVGRDRALRRVLGVGLLALASLLFIPPWLLVPSLVFSGVGLLGVQPFRFGACGSQERAPAGSGKGCVQRGSVQKSSVEKGPVESVRS